MSEPTTEDVAALMGRQLEVLRERDEALAALARVAALCDDGPIDWIDAQHIRAAIKEPASTARSIK